MIQSNNLSCCRRRSFNNIVTSGPATDALERSLKRRRVSDSEEESHELLRCNQENNHNNDYDDDDNSSTSTINALSCSDKSNTNSIISSIICNGNDNNDRINMIKTSSLLFSFDDAFNAINSIEDENYIDFPAIAWSFDDE